VRAMAGEHQRASPADSAAAAGHHRNFAMKAP